MTEKVVRKSLTEQAYSLIIDEIRNGELKPGDRINIEGLAKKFDVSRTPLREAISRLVQNGFIETKHNVGPSVAVYDRKKVTDLIEANAILSNETVRMILSGPVRRECLNDLQQVVEEQREAYEAGDTQTFFRKSMLFHETILSECQNLKLRQLALDTETQLGIWVLQYQESDAVRRNGMNVHQQLVELLKKKCYEEFITLLWEHNKQPMEHFENME
jgi:DNA-binding GntR family transcriptional regulator